MNLDEFIATFTDAEPDESNEHGHTYRGSGVIATGAMHALQRFVPRDFVERESWSNGFRVVWVNEVDMSIIATVEGDVSVFLAHDRVAWLDERDAAHKFYLLHP